MTRSSKAKRRGGGRNKKNKGKKAQTHPQRAASVEQQHTETEAVDAVEAVETAGDVADVEDNGEGPSTAPLVGSILGGVVYASPEMMSPRTLAAFPRVNHNADVSDMDLTDPSSVEGVKMRKKRKKVKACADDTEDDMSSDSSSSDDEDDDEMPAKDVKGKGKAPTDKGKDKQASGNSNGEASKQKSQSKSNSKHDKGKGKQKENIPPSTPEDAILNYGGPSTAGTVWSPGYKTPSPPPGLGPMSSPIVVRNRSSASHDDVFAPGPSSQRGGRSGSNRRGGSGGNRRRRRTGVPHLRDGPVRHQVVHEVPAAARAQSQVAQIEFAPPPLEDISLQSLLANASAFTAPRTPPPVPARAPARQARNDGTVNPAHLSLRPVPTAAGLASASSSAAAVFTAQPGSGTGSSTNGNNQGSSSQQGNSANGSNATSGHTFPRAYNFTEINPRGNLLIILVVGNANNVLEKFLVIADNLAQLSLVWDGRLLEWRAEVIPRQDHESGMHANAQHLYATSGPSDVPFRDYLRLMLGDIFGREIGGDNDALARVADNIANGREEFPPFPFPVVQSECHKKPDRIYCCDNGGLNGFGRCDYHKYKQVHGKMTIDIGQWIDGGVSRQDAITVFRSIFGVSHDRDDLVPTPLSPGQLAAHLDLTARMHMGIIMRTVLQNRLDIFGTFERAYLHRDGPFAYNMHRHLAYFHQHGQHLEYRNVTPVRHMKLNANTLSKLSIYWFLRDRNAFELTIRRVAWQSYLVGADGQHRLNIHLVLTDPAVDEGGQDGTQTNRITVPSGHVLHHHIGAVRFMFVWRLVHYANSSFARLWHHYKTHWNTNKTDGAAILYKCRAVGVTDVDRAWCDYAHLHALIKHMLTLNVADYAGIPDPSVVMNNANPEVGPPKFLHNVRLWRRAPHSLLEFIEDTVETVHESAMAFLGDHLECNQDTEKHRACRGSMDTAVEAGYKFLFETRNFPHSALYPFTVLSARMTDPMRQNRAALCQMEVPFDNSQDQPSSVPTSAGAGSNLQLPGEDAVTVDAAHNFLNDEFSAMLTGLGINVADNEYDDDDDRYEDTDGEANDETEDEE